MTTHHMLRTAVDVSQLRALSSTQGRFIAAILCFVIFTVAKIAPNRPLVQDNDKLEPDAEAVQSFSDRANCQIVYVLGVEGTSHHGVTPILETLARQQIDPATDSPYDVSYSNEHLRAALFGFHKETRTIDNESMVRQTIRKICPHNGQKHVIMEDASFPCGTDDDPRSYRIHRQWWWKQSTMEQIAMSDTALNHPTNLDLFYKAFSPYADIKFVVLHRPFIETIASRAEYDAIVKQHSVVIRGFMLLIRRFLDSHPVDNYTGNRLWTLICVEKIGNKYYGEDEERMNSSRQRMLSHLVDFFGWSRAECTDCFLKWKESRKNHLENLGKENVAMLIEHARKLGGIWPPQVENPLEEQKCSL